MMTFRDTLSLWLASHGLDSEQCAKVLDHPRMALTMRTRDSGGALTDLPDALYALSASSARTAQQALYRTEEKFLLMQALTHVSDNLRNRSAPVQKSKPLRMLDLTLVAIGTASCTAEQQWFAQLGSQRRALSAESVSEIAQVAKVSRGIWWIHDHPVITRDVLEGVMPRVFAQLGDTFGLLTTSDTALELRVVDADQDAERANSLEILLQVPSADYLAFIERLGSQA